MDQQEQLEQLGRLVVLARVDQLESLVWQGPQDCPVLLEVPALLETLVHPVLPVSLAHLDLTALPAPMDSLGLEANEERLDRPEVQERPVKLDFPGRLDCRARPEHRVLPEW